LLTTVASFGALFFHSSVSCISSRAATSFCSTSLCSTSSCSRSSKHSNLFLDWSFKRTNSGGTTVSSSRPLNTTLTGYGLYG
ncbi:hypothetical protein KCU90_g129, partial [Aureobasidium melanogenum]